MNWRKDEARVQNPDVELLLERMWGAAFPQCRGQTVVPHGDTRQRWGIDRELHLTDGQTLNVEEKIRFREYPGDMLIEVEHVFDDGRTEPGWIRKPMQTHYLGMLWMPCRTMRIYPWQALVAWYTHRVNDGRIKEYARVTTRANNNGYKTVSVVVPERDLPCLIKTRENRG